MRWLPSVHNSATAAEGRKTFTILHTNDIHSNLIGVGPAAEYTPATLNDDRTIGGIERIATLIAERRRAREADGPVLVLDIGDATIGTPFGGASQQTGAELQCLSLAGYDATTFGNHDFDFGPGGPRQCRSRGPQCRPPARDSCGQHELRCRGRRHLRAEGAGPHGGDPQPHDDRARRRQVRTVRHDGAGFHPVHDQSRRTDISRSDRNCAGDGRGGCAPKVRT